MSNGMYWFRSDLRLADNSALVAACKNCDRLLLLALVPADTNEPTAWGFPRWSAYRTTFRAQALQGLQSEVAVCGGELLIIEGFAATVIPAMAQTLGIDQVFCEAIAAPQEIAEIAALREANLTVYDHWQSSLLDPSNLPFPIEELPERFTAFRHAVERAGAPITEPAATPFKLPPMPVGTPRCSWVVGDAAPPQGEASFPFNQPRFHGSEHAGLAHLKRYFSSALPQTYKASRNELMGVDYSTKLSPWLAVGALSPRTVYQHLKEHEEKHGATESTYWIWFELLWRDFFRFWSMKQGARLFRARGLGRAPPSAHDPSAFRSWCTGDTGQSLIDAGMRELAATGYLSNRMRQVVASYLVYDLACDWRSGAAWFESRLIDYDVCSNQGNWLYIAGRGTDPRQGRRFNPDKQAQLYDSDGEYRRLWSNFEVQY